MRLKITKRSVDAFLPDSKRTVTWDTEVKGFGLTVLPTGVKTYFYRYRTPEGRERQPTIGKHGAWTPDQARRAAEDMREEPEPYVRTKLHQQSSMLIR